MAPPSPPPPRRLGQLLRCSNKEALEQREQDTIALLMEQQDHQVVPKPAPPFAPPPTPYETTSAAVGSKGIAMWEIAQQIRVLAEQLEAQRHQASVQEQPFLSQTLHAVHQSLASFEPTDRSKQPHALASRSIEPTIGTSSAQVAQPGRSDGNAKSRDNRRQGAKPAIRKKVSVAIAPPPTQLTVSSDQRAVALSPRKSSQHAEKTPRHSNVTRNVPKAQLPPVTSSSVTFSTPATKSLRQRPTQPSATEVVLTATTSVAPPAVEVTMSTNPKNRTLADVEASLSLLERTIQQQKQPPPVQSRSTTKPVSRRSAPPQRATADRRSETPGRPNSQQSAMRHRETANPPVRQGESTAPTEPARRRASTPGRVRGRPVPTITNGALMTREKQHAPPSLAATNPTSTTFEETVGSTVPSTASNQEPHNGEPKTVTPTRPTSLRSKSAGRHRLVRVIASAGPSRSSSVGRDRPREPMTPQIGSSHGIEFVTFENTKRVNTMTARNDSVGMKLQRRHTTVEEERDSLHKRLESTKTGQTHSSSRQHPETSKTLWDRILGSPTEGRREEIRTLDEIVRGTMASSTQSPIPLLSTSSSSSTYHGINAGQVSLDAISNAENRHRGEAHPSKVVALSQAPSKIVAPSRANSVHRSKRSEFSGILSPNNDGPRQQTIKYRSMMNEFEKGIEIFPQDKATSPGLDTCLSEVSSSMSRYDPDVLRHRAALSERLRRQQRKIEQLQRELDVSYQRRAVAPPAPPPTQSNGVEMGRTRGLEERRRTQAMLEMLDNYTSLWNSNGECESEDSVLRSSPLRQSRTTSSKRSQSAKLIIRE